VPWLLAATLPLVSCGFDSAALDTLRCDATSAACAAGTICQDGYCLPPVCGGVCYDGPAGTSQTTPCRSGTLDCAGAGPVCVDQVLPVSSETCNGVDDDCNGTPDNGATCDGQQTCCGGACVDTQTDADHCGGCAGQGGVACGNNEVCCDGACINASTYATDIQNCGSCGHACQAPDDACCNAACVNTQNDPSHCGSCDCVCAATGCNGGVCVCQ